jgi:hypothetical protein
MHHLVDKTRVVCKDMVFIHGSTVAYIQRTGQTCERRETWAETKISKHQPGDLETLIIRGTLGKTDCTPCACVHPDLVV